MNMGERLVVFLQRLEAAAPAASADEAMALVCRLMEEVEEELCPIPREEPPPLRFTGRMYAPRQDRMVRLPSGTLIAETRRHRIFCKPNGAILIAHMPEGATILSKSGK